MTRVERRSATTRCVRHQVPPAVRGQEWEGGAPVGRRSLPSRELTVSGTRGNGGSGQSLKRKKTFLLSSRALDLYQKLELVPAPSLDQRGFPKVTRAGTGPSPGRTRGSTPSCPAAPSCSLSLSCQSLWLWRNRPAKSYCTLEVEGKIKNNLLFIYNLCMIHHLLPKRV